MNALKYGVRALGKRRGFAAVVVVTLALGIGINAALFSIVHAVLLSPLPFREADRIVILSEHSRTMDTGLVSPITFDDWNHRNEVFSDLAALRYWENRMIEFGSSAPEPILQVTATPNYFQVLGYRPLLGRTFAEEKAGGANEAVLSYELWRRRFNARPDILGSTVHISGSAFAIVGVMPPAPHDISIGWGDIWTPLHWYNMEHNRATSYRSRYLRVFGRLKSGISMDQARIRMEILQQQLARETTSVAAGYSVRLESLDHALAGRFRSVLLLLWSAVGLVLLITCANVANLILARGVEREKELAIRTALGARRREIVKQLLVESSLLVLMGAFLGLGLAQAGLRVLKYSLASTVPRIAEAGLSVPVLLFTLVLAGVLTIVFGVLPIAELSGGVVETLKEAGRTGGGGMRRKRLRSFLVAAEFAFAVLLLAGAGLLLKSFTRVIQVNPGFATANRVLADVVLPGNEYKEEAKRTAFYRDLLRRLNESAGVRSSGGALYFPERSKLWLATIWREGVNVAKGEEPIVYFNLYAGDYFQAMGIPLLHGRLPTERESWEPSDVVVINEAMAQQIFGNADPLTQRIKTDEDGRWNRIIGVVGNVRQKSLDESPKPELYVPFSRMPMTFLTLVTDTSAQESQAFNVIRRVVRESNRAATVSGLSSLDKLVAQTIVVRRLAFVLMLLFAVLALVLSALGIYGVMSYFVSQRRSEIGVRIALGATANNVLRLIMGEGLRTALVGSSVGALAALLSGRALGSLLYGVQAADQSVYIAMTGIVLITALVASYIPARRAMRVDPVAAIRQE